MPIYTATFASVLVLIGGMFGKAACGFLADHIGVRGAFSTLQGLAALGLVLLVMAPSTAAFILLPFLGVVVQGTSSITYVIVNDLIHPERTARGYSLVYSTTSIASVVGPLGFGVIGDIYGIEVAMQAMAVTSVAAILPCWFVKPR
jgi:MFS family permease